MSKCKIKDIEIAYAVKGSGEPLMLIGGFTMVKESWRLQMEGLMNTIEYDDIQQGGNAHADRYALSFVRGGIS
jgi:hypothetical protein